MRALIAVAAQKLPPGDVRAWGDDAVALPSRYIRALHRAGGQEGILMPVRAEADEAAGPWGARAMGPETPDCSPSHHQAVARVGQGLEVTGRADDGIIEAVEHREGSWVVGVQWHPERGAADDPAQQGLF